MTRVVIQAGHCHRKTGVVGTSSADGYRERPFEYIGQPKGITELASAERGKLLFETRGCLACHSHVDFPGIKSDQGPDLSRLAAKLNTPKGQQWLYSWVKSPSHYYPRTAMPNLGLSEAEAADVAAYLYAAH